MKETNDYPPAGSHALPARSAMLFWFGTSLVVWAAVAISVIWLL